MPEIYRQHNCQRKHRTYAALAKCIWKSALWIAGDGPYASVSRCGHSGPRPWNKTTVILFTTAEEAQNAKKQIDQFECGGQCTQKHEVIHLVA